MNLIYSRIKDYNHHFDKRQHSFADFEAMAKRENVKIRLVDYPAEIKGYYCIRKQKRYTEKFIVINKNLTAFEKLYVAFHELAHCLLHVPFSERDYFYCSLHKKTHEKQGKRSRYRCFDYADSAMVAFSIAGYAVRRTASVYAGNTD